MNEFISSGRHGLIDREAGEQAESEVKRLFECGTSCLYAGRVSEAYICFSRIRRADCAVLFNLTLCYVKAGRFEEAYDVLNRAEQQLVCSGVKMNEDQIYNELFRRDCREDGYTCPMSYDMPALLPVSSRVQVLRLKADVAYELGLYDEVEKIAGFLSIPCKNVEEKIRIIHQR